MGRLVYFWDDSRGHARSVGILSTDDEVLIQKVKELGIDLGYRVDVKQTVITDGAPKK